MKLLLMNFIWFLLADFPIIVKSFTQFNHVFSKSHHVVNMQPIRTSSKISIRLDVSRTSSQDMGSPTPLSMPVDQLGRKLNGQGRALTTWDCYKIGLDPLYFFSGDESDHENSALSDIWDQNVLQVIKQTPFNYDAESQIDIEEHEEAHDQSTDSNPFFTDRNEIVEKYMPMKRRDIHSKSEGKGMGHKALNQLADLYPNTLGLEYSIASLVNVQRSSDGTVKLLLKLNSKRYTNNSDSNNNDAKGSSNQHYYIESVIIPWYDRSQPTSTLCMSSQVGCAQGCTFCATGKMGLMKQLTTDEILIQLYYAKKVCRILNQERLHPSNNDNKIQEKLWLPDIDNIVFMGMGDSGHNSDAVIHACSIMADRQCFAIPQNKITISTVGPNPDTFKTLSNADAVLAWSVHAVNDELRKKLVPTTKYTMDELREGLIESLINRSKRMRSVMFEVTLIEDMNDSVKEAKELVEFCNEMKSRVDGMKLVVNLIPFNDIGHRSYKRSPDENIARFQSVLVDNGVKTYVRTTRGDDEDAACGQLATKKLKATKRVED